MNIRGLALALAACFGLASIAGAEIVVLINGNRMDVKSYEIQSNVVLVTTWEDKIQSFPITWVDVEATRNVSHQYDPSEGIPPERLRKARTLLDDFGVKNGVAGLFDELEVEIRSLQVGVSRPTYDVVRGAFRNAYDSERIFEVVAADFSRGVDDALLDRWSRWMSRPENRQFLATESAEQGDDDAIDQSRYLAELYSNPEMTYRQELLARLDRAMLASQSALEIASALTASLQDTKFLVLTNPPERETVEEIRARLWPDVQAATLDSLLFSYRMATNEEVLSYIEFWESEDGRRIAQLTVQSLASGAQYGAEMAVHSVAEGTGGTIER